MQTEHPPRLLHLGFLPMAIILLTVITAAIHLSLSVQGFLTGQEGPFPFLFLCNFAGYIVLVTALYLPRFQHIQRLIRWLLIAYTALTIILWYVIASSHAEMLDYIDKLVEATLIILLLVEDFWPHLHRA